MPQSDFTIENVNIGLGNSPYIIAEISGNHNKNIERAKRLIQIAHDAGASAVKLQTYTADSLTINSTDDLFMLKEGTWKNKNLYELYEEAHTPWSWFPELFSFASEIGITIFSSPFDLKAVELLKDLDAPAYKIASNELTDWPLIEAVVKTNKPIILSTGTANKDDIAKTLEFIEHLGGISRVAVLHCVSAYPAMAKDSNLRTMIDIRESFDVTVGLSDHTIGVTTSVTAVAMGASIIEKHITLDRNDGGPDSSFSLEPDELLLLCESVKDAADSIGEIKYGGSTDLSKKNIFTRQLWSTEKIRKGDLFTWDNIRSIRAPSGTSGLSPMNYKKVIGQRSTKNILKHMPISENDVSRNNWSSFDE